MYYMYVNLNCASSRISYPSFPDFFFEKFAGVLTTPKESVLLSKADGSELADMVRTGRFKLLPALPHQQVFRHSSNFADLNSPLPDSPSNGGGEGAYSIGKLS